MTRAVIRPAAVATLALGVALQFVQHTDPRFPLRYFTVDSAIFAVAVLAWTLLIGRDRPTARGAATLGVVMSGLVFALVIAPSAEGGWWQSGDDLAVRGATILMHGLGPILVVADLVAHPFPQRHRLREVRTWLLWPIAYIVVLTVLELGGVASIPYSFLDPASPGWFALAVLALLALFGGVGTVLLAVAGRGAEHTEKAGDQG